MEAEILVKIKGLTVEFVYSMGFIKRQHKRVTVLTNFDLEIFRGETLGVVGESGCGKTTLANALARFIRPSAGQILFENLDLVTLAVNDLRLIRRNIQTVFQNPFNSLNPRMTVAQLVAEPIITQTDLRKSALKKRVLELLEDVGLTAEHLDRHPHELSGGQAERVAIARALALNPQLLLLDEPTSALDVSVQAQVINLLEKLQHQHTLTYLFISHSLGVVQHISNRIGVMYLGELVEIADRDEIVSAPQHPYTKALFSSTPIPDPDSGHKRIHLEGTVPSLSVPPSGCRFHTRCPFVMEICRVEKPLSQKVGFGHWVNCHLLHNS